MGRRTLLTSAMVIGFLVVPTAAWACGGLVAPNGAVNLVRTTTFVGYHDGNEHYVTSFEFAGGGAEFGSIVPLPGVPSKIQRAGDWTLQRLLQEVAPPVVADFAVKGAALSAPEAAKVLIEAEVDALDITVLEGGADEVIVWAEQHGFDLSPDAPEVLGYYASRSPYFMAARFNPQRAEEFSQGIGDGTPIHLTIPTDDPWVPLRILALAKGPKAPVEADLFLLTDDVPTLLPAPVGTGIAGGPIAEGMVLDRSEPASPQLLRDLRSDKGMKWLPRQGMWLTYLKIDAEARDVTYDLAVDVDGTTPSWRAAGFLPPGLVGPGEPVTPRPGPLQTTPVGDRAPNLWPLWLAFAAIGAWALGRSRERAAWLAKHTPTIPRRAEDL